MSISKFKGGKSLFLYKNCCELKQGFYSLKTSRDIANLLDTSYDRLVYHLYKVSDERKYIQFAIRKKSGSSRIISAPATALKIIQRKFSQVLYSVYEPKITVHGFTPSRSILTNAKQHVRKNLY